MKKEHNYGKIEMVNFWLIIILFLLIISKFIDQDEGGILATFHLNDGFYNFIIYNYVYFIMIGIIIRNFWVLCNRGKNITVSAKNIEKNDKTILEKSSKSNFKIPKKVNNKNNNLNIFTIALITLCIISGTVIINTYIKEQGDKELTKLKLEETRKTEKERQDNLQQCITDADIARTDLWASNCPAKNPNCKLDSYIVEWIDKRYEQNLNNCYQLYGN